MQERAAPSWRRRRPLQSVTTTTHQPCESVGGSPQQQQQQQRHADKKDDDGSLDAVFSTTDLLRPTWQKTLRSNNAQRIILFLVTLTLFILMQVSLMAPTPWGPRMLRSSKASLYNPRASLAGIPLSRAAYEEFPYYSPTTTTTNAIDSSAQDDNQDDLAASITHHHKTSKNSQKSNDKDDGDSPPFLHFVHTRFMQEQGNLTALGMARLYLFQIFCLPTMLHQSTSNFLWLIRFDPDLDSAVFSALYRLVRHVPNIYLIASNNNFRINQDFPGAWRDGAQAADLQASRIYTGNARQLQVALQRVHDTLILESRLDADDGLERHYLETVQHLALQEFGTAVVGNHDLQWKYWCAKRHLEWHWAVPVPTHDLEEAATPMTAGTLKGAQRTDMCITPGITVAFPVGVQEANVPVFPHHELVTRVAHLPLEQRCTRDKEKACLDFVPSRSFNAIRSRTPTSAGMMAVLVEEPDLSAHVNAEWLKYISWKVLAEDFGLSRAQVAWMQSYLTRHLSEIGNDNLHGQCTTGHSCKPQAKRDLERLVALAKASSSAGGESVF